MSVRTDIDIGTSVYSAERVHGGSEEPLGGVVLERLTAVHYDPDTGEVFDSYFVIDHRRLRPNLRFDTLTSAEVGDTEKSSTQRLRILVRRLCQEVAMDGYKPRQGAMTGLEGEYVRWAWTLLQAMGGPDAGR